MEEARVSFTTNILKTRGPAGAAHRWGWFVALGVVLVAIAAVAWFEVVAVTLVSVIFIGAALLLGGVFQILQAFMVRAWSGFLLHVLMGLLYVLGGLLIMAEPATGAVVITVFLAVCLGIAGIMRIWLALQHRELTGWWLMLFSGVITFLIAILLYSTLPWSGLWVLGTLIAVELAIQGITWIQFGLMLRRMPPAAAVP
jgi:uncharacterized membrane protein HdeD (DUF308 family)